MIAWFGIAVIAIALAAAILCLVAAARKLAPNDYTMGATLLVALLLIAQVIVGIVAPFAGNHAAGIRSSSGCT
ncbi:hypothetical protein [Leucobacter insecticola]|uniref:hypothetical protein n=1 Tax=Leucobacter insecticola TaxID=2714934 RepID=UPI001FCC6901|nr:hypothetical protein [Leucobacter insecticola]